ncbi:ABC transporter ATP-binding protein [Saliphagus sp. GCM10025334]
MALLETENLTKRFGGITAVDGVDLEVESGEVVGLIGPNGAGKTTMFDCLTGFQQPTEGRVRFDGQDVTDDSPATRARHGMVRTFQLTRELTTMTVKENMQVAVQDHPGDNFWRAIRQGPEVQAFEDEVEATADRLLKEASIEHMAETYAGNLSGGQRKLLSVARAMMVEPDLFLLDEPFAGVSGENRKRIIDYVTGLNEQGKTFVVIEHSLGDLMELVDRMVVLNEGRILADATPKEVVENDAVISAYMGEPLEESTR